LQRTGILLVENEIQNDVAHKIEYLLENLKMLQAFTKDSG
jgi:hypothetical protein